MTPERWQQIKELFQSALERDPSQRTAFLDEACAGDPPLRRQVEALLAFHEQAASFIEAPAFEASARLLADDHPESMIGRRIGSYKVLREIGQGGMGTVYLAVRADDQHQKQVAIKLVKRGTDTDFILRRFRNERQLLASLDHPNIAKLLEGGTTDKGLPYFVMDYVEGLPIDVYCDTHKLSTVERLKHFRTVCSAIHYAHQNLVVHRDLKPSNILVTAEGVPKLLDFGVAKLLNPELSSHIIEPTSALRLMTPKYASPEQVRGEPVTTASDVYSLGVLLYELLTGHYPYRVQSHQPREIERAIREEEPEKPSTAVGRVEEVPGADGTPAIRLTSESISKTRDGQPDKLRRRLTGDLDDIVLMAMHKEPQRRYASVEQFSEDIRRHLEGLPVIARKDTPLYRSTKFIKRNKAGVIAAGLLAVTLLAGIAATTWEARVAKTQRAKAERRFNDVRKLANSFMFEFYDAIQNLPGSTPARGLLVNRALDYLDRLAQEASGDTSLQRELALAYQKVGDVQGHPAFANLGDTAGALQSHRKALSIREALLAADPMSAQARRDLTVSHERMGDMLALTGDTAGALGSYRKSLSIREALLAADPMSAQARRDLSVIYDRIGNILAATGDAAGALESYRKSLAIREALSAADPTNAKARRDLATSYDKSGGMLATTGDAAGALESYRKALSISEALSTADPTDARARRDLATSYNKIGNTLAATGDTAGALESYRKSLAIFEVLSAADPLNAQARGDLSVGYNKVGEILAKIGDTAGALESYRKALSISEALSTADPTNAEVRRSVAESYSSLGQVYAILASNAKAPVGKRIERWWVARSWYQRSLDIFLDMRNRGTLNGSDAGVPDKLVGEIAKCNVALAKLRGLLVPGPTDKPKS